MVHRGGNKKTDLLKCSKQTSTLNGVGSSTDSDSPENEMAPKKPASTLSLQARSVVRGNRNCPPSIRDVMDILSLLKRKDFSE
jgi:hypothetical protein